MEIVLFILLAAVWAVFLIPSFFNSRKEAPINSTQDFARNAARLNAVRVSAVEPAVARRRRTLARRRRTLLLLITAAIASLAAAIWTGSVALLGVNLAVDMALAAYVAILFQVNQQPAPRAIVVPMQQVESTEEQAQIRVVAG